MLIPAAACSIVFLRGCLCVRTCACLHEAGSLRGKREESDEFNDIMLPDKWPPDAGRARLPLTFLYLRFPHLPHPPPGHLPAAIEQFLSYSLRVFRVMTHREPPGDKDL